MHETLVCQFLYIQTHKYFSPCLSLELVESIYFFHVLPHHPSSQLTSIFLDTLIFLSLNLYLPMEISNANISIWFSIYQYLSPLLFSISLCICLSAYQSIDLLLTLNQSLFLYIFLSPLINFRVFLYLYINLSRSLILYLFFGVYVYINIGPLLKSLSIHQFPCLYFSIYFNFSFVYLNHIYLSLSILNPPCLYIYIYIYICI